MAVRVKHLGLSVGPTRRWTLSWRRERMMGELIIPLISSSFQSQFDCTVQILYSCTTIDIQLMKLTTAMDNDVHVNLTFVFFAVAHCMDL